MAQIPKGRLVKGPHKPICRDCAIYSSIATWYSEVDEEHGRFVRNVQDVYDTLKKAVADLEIDLKDVWWQDDDMEHKRDMRCVKSTAAHKFVNLSHS